MRKKRWFKFLKWFVGIIFGFVLLISGALYFFKDDIINVVIGELNKKLQTRVQVQKVDLTFWQTFPNLSVNFDNVFVEDTILGRFPKDTLFYSDKIQLKINPMDIWNKEYRVKSISIAPGKLRMCTNEDGQNNFSILKAKKDSLPTQEFNVELKKISISDFYFSYNDKKINQFYRAKIDEMEIEGALSESKFSASTKSRLKIENAQSGKIKLVQNKSAEIDLKIQVNQDSNSVVFPLSTISIAGLPFAFSGEVFPDEYNFLLQGKQIPLQDVANNLAITSTKKIKDFSGSGNLVFDLKVNQQKGRDVRPNISCDFSIENGALREPKTNVSVKKINLFGKYRSGQSVKNEILNLSQFDFVSSVGPFNGRLEIVNFSTPIFKGTAKGALDLFVLQTFLPVAMIEKMTGKIDVNSDFKVQSIQNRLDVKKCSGNLTIQNASFSLKEDSRIFNNINGDFYLRKNKAGFQSLDFSVGKSQVNLSGFFQNIVPFLRGKGILFADVKLKSGLIRTKDFESNIDGKNEPKIEVVGPKTYVLPENIDGKIQLDVAKVEVGKHNFNDLKGKFRISKRLLDLQSIKFSHIGVNVNASLKFAEISPQFLNLSGKIQTKNANIKSIMREWNAFNQEIIKTKNIDGDATVSVDLKAPISLENGLIAFGVNAKIDLKLQNGRLKNVELLHEVAQSARKNGGKLLLGKKNIDYISQQLSDLKFKTLKNSFTINKGIVTMPKMKIESSALNFSLAGTHTFENKIDYRMSFRFKDLKRPQTSEFGIIEDDGTGIWIYLKMTGVAENPKISWDKQSKKEARKEYNKQEKETIKSMLKSELGLFKNDSTVKSYQPKSRPKDLIEIDFESTSDKENTEGVPKIIKKKNPFFEKWKKEKNNESSEEMEIEWE